MRALGRASDQPDLSTKLEMIQKCLMGSILSGLENTSNLRLLHVVVH